MDESRMMELLAAKEPEIERADRYFFGGASFSERVRRFFYPFVFYGPKGFYWFTWLSPRISKTKLFWGKEISVNLPDGIVTTFYGALSPSEIPLTKFLIRTLKNDSVFYDVGAHLGFFTCLAGELVHSGEVHSFEANPSTFGLLKANGDRPNMTLNQTAVAGAPGERTFHADLKRMFGTSGFSPKNANSNYDVITVHATSIDEYAKSHKAPTVMKVDVEGAEEEVVRGGIQTLTHGSPTVIMEIWKTADGAMAQSPAAEIMKNLGYRLYGITKDGGLELLQTPDHAKNFGSENFVFKKG